jgi:hypothetical protein
MRHKSTQAKLEVVVAVIRTELAYEYGVVVQAHLSA